MRKRRSYLSQESRDRTMSMERGFHNILTNSGQRSRASSMNSNNSVASPVTNSPTLSLKAAIEKAASWQERNENFSRFRCNSLTIGNNTSSLEGSRENLHAHTRSLSLDVNTDKNSPHQYDILSLTEKTKLEKKPEIVAKICVTTENNLKPVEIMLDIHGYSHIPADVNRTGDVKRTGDAESNVDIPKTDPKIDSIRNNSTNIEPVSESEIEEHTHIQREVLLPIDNPEEKRSLSTGSHDSGVSCPSIYQPPTTDETIQRNKESFDSAISNSEIRASIAEAIVVTDSSHSGFSRSFSQPHNMYLNEPKNERSNSEPAKAVVCEATGYANVEGEYEDLDKYRKDLKKFLGMSDKPPEEVPPSLPERPSSLPPTRKVIKDSKRKRVSFTAFGNNRSSLSSSDSDDAEHDVAAITTWPIGQNTGNNTLYSTVDRNANVVEAKPTDSDQNLYETIPAAAGEENSGPPISSIKAWPLNRTAQANCNRFYESNLSISKPTPAAVQEVPETEPLSNTGQSDVSKDFLTGDGHYLSSTVLPVLSPTKQAPFVDLLCGDIADQSPKLPVLDVLLPFSIEEIKNSQWNIDMTQLNRSNPDAVENPFPNIARYSAAMESLSENRGDSVGSNTTVPECNDLVSSENSENAMGPSSAKTEKDLIDFEDNESSPHPKPPLEDVYMVMDEREPVYVQPSTLQSSD